LADTCKEKGDEHVQKVNKLVSDGKSNSKKVDK
jgi:hypothetical protein